MRRCRPHFWLGARDDRKLRYTILLHFAFNAGSYLMGLLWFVNTPLDVVVTVAIAGFVLVEAMRSLLRSCIPEPREADRPDYQ